MKLEVKYPEDVLVATVRWSHRTPYANARELGSPHDDIANLYLITAQWAAGAEKIIYIGKTYNQTVHDRLNQPDHARRYCLVCEKYKHHQKFVRHGHITLNCRMTAKRVDDIESLLIYSHACDTLVNVSNTRSFDIKNSYKIINTFSKGPLTKEIYYGLFIK